MQHDLINEEVIKNIVKEVVSGYQTMPPKKTGQNDVEVLVEASGRHVHLSQQDIERLFGKGYKLTPKKNLSQIGQFASEERVTLIGPKNVYRNVAVLGPARKETQVELSLSDARFLGVDAPLRMSGDLSGAAGIIIATEIHSSQEQHDRSKKSHSYDTRTGESMGILGRAGSFGVNEDNEADNL